jgi:hypothetical protein
VTFIALNLLVFDPRHEDQSQGKTHRRWRSSLVSSSTVLYFIFEKLRAQVQTTTSVYGHGVAISPVFTAVLRGDLSKGETQLEAVGRSSVVTSIFG